MMHAVHYPNRNPWRAIGVTVEGVENYPESGTVVGGPWTADDAGVDALSAYVEEHFGTTAAEYAVDEAVAKIARLSASPL